MFEEIRRERLVRRVLVALSRQRVAIHHQPANVWVLEKAVPDGDGVDEALRTCHLRGWVEVIQEIPTARIDSFGQFPGGITHTGVKPLYRLTDAGWNQIRRTHSWVIATFLVSAAALVAALWPILWR